MVKREDNGQLIEALGTAMGAVKTEAANVSSFSTYSPTFVTQHEVSSEPFKLRYLRYYSKGSGFVTIHNKNAAVANGDAPFPSFLLSVNGGASGSFPLPPNGLSLDQGCQIAFVTLIGSDPTPSITLGAANIEIYAEGDPIV